MSLMQELTAPQKTDTSTFADVSPSRQMALRRFLIVAAITALVLQASFNVLFFISVHFANRSNSFGIAACRSCGQEYLGFYAAGKIVLEGNRLRLYDQATQEAVQHRIFPRVQFRYGALLVYHPAYELLAFALLALLPFAASYYVWSIANVLLLVLVLHFSKPYLKELLCHWRLLPMAMALSLFPLFECVILGEDSVLLLLIFTCAFVLLKRKRHWTAGCLLSLGLFKFQFMVPFLLPFAFNKKSRNVLRGAIPMAAVLVMISVWVTGIPGAMQYLRMVALDPTSPNAASAFPWAMPNWRGLVTSTLSPQMGNPATVIVILFGSLLFVGLVAYCFRRWWTETTLDLLYSLNLVVAILVGYHTYLPDLTLLLLPLWFVGNYVAARCVSQRAAAIAVGSVLLAVPIYAVCWVRDQVYWLGLPLLAGGCVISILIWTEWKRSIEGNRIAGIT